MVSNKAIRAALYTKLNVASVTSQLGSGSASLVHEVAPPTAAYPICLFGRQSDVSRLRMGGNAFDSQIWMVKGIVRDTSASVAEDIDKAVRDLLDFGSLTITGGSLMHLARESGIDYTETDGDKTYRHAGSLYRLIVQT
jgi:hypothetical protein